MRLLTLRSVLNVGFMPDDEKNSISLVTKAITCTPRPADDYRLKTRPFDKASSGKTIVYQVPFEEFSLLSTPQTDVYEEIGPLAGPLIGVVTSDTEGVLEHVGAGDADKQIKAGRGTIVFLGAGEKMRVGPGQRFFAAFFDE